VGEKHCFRDLLHKMRSNTSPEFFGARVKSDFLVRMGDGLIDRMGLEALRREALPRFRDVSLG